MNNAFQSELEGAVKIRLKHQPALWAG
jgi:hypothetical protein